jgi:hypothetical protein
MLYPWRTVPSITVKGLSVRNFFNIPDWSIWFESICGLCGGFIQFGSSETAEDTF